MSKEFKLPSFLSKDAIKTAISNRKTHFEINLVPDIKNEMIKTLKLRNFIFFLCIVVAAASVGVTILAGVIAGGQQAAIDGKKSTIDKLSAKLESYADLSDYLTIKDQLSGISSLTNDKRVLSRTFNILSTFLPTGADTITISELELSFADNQPVLSFEAQANSGTDPYIDYAVLEAFKKSMDEMRYDYGNYVDKDGNPIPSYCMIETGSDGSMLAEIGRNGLSSQDTKSYYAYWLINGEGCNPAIDNTTNNTTDGTADSTTSSDSTAGYELEDYDGQQVVKIWRTPQREWYQENSSDSQPSISLDGTISNVAHFNSSCITYTGEGTSSIQWTKTNSCALVPGGSTEGVAISDSSNGRDSDNQLVLRFNANIMIAPEAYQFINTHMMAIGPSSRQNVTDSYKQVQAMFGQRAKDCSKDDADCNANATNVNGGN